MEVIANKQERGFVLVVCHFLFGFTSHRLWGNEERSSMGWYNHTSFGFGSPRALNIGMEV
jgi:hypothetical protein